MSPPSYVTVLSPRRIEALPFRFYAMDVCSTGHAVYLLPTIHTRAFWR